MASEVITFGCRLNIYESEVIKNALTKADANDVIVINSCAVTKEAERQVRQAIRKARKLNPDKKIIVTGCAAQLHPDSFANMAEVDLVVGNDQKMDPESYKILSSTEQHNKIFVTDIMEVKETASHLVSSFEGKARAFVQVQNGCDHRCTFCIIPYGRGNSRSVPIGAIVEQSKKLIDVGYQEIVLTGVDLTAYGADLPASPNLGGMIRRLLNLVPGLPRLRLSSLDVAEIDDELFEQICFEPRLMPHMHISLQAGDNMILKRMKRRHNREQVIEFCHQVREKRPDTAFGADIIAGFPTETDDMHQNNVNLIHQAQLQYLHVFPYSEREGTPAAKMPQVEKSIRKKRAAELRQAGEQELEKFLKTQIGTIQKVIIEKDNEARTENFALVKLDKIIDPGTIVKCQIIDSSEKDLQGTVL